MFCLTTTTRASAAAGKKDELYGLLKKNGYGDLVYETVNANSLSAFVQGADGGEQRFITRLAFRTGNVYEKTSVGVRKAAR